MLSVAANGRVSNSLRMTYPTAYSARHKRQWNGRTMRLQRNIIAFSENIKVSILHIWLRRWFEPTVVPVHYESMMKMFQQSDEWQNLKNVYTFGIKSYLSFCFLVRIRNDFNYTYNFVIKYFWPRVVYAIWSYPNKISLSQNIKF